MRTFLTRAIAGTAIATAAALTAAGVASAATSTTPVKAPTTLTVVAAKAEITVGQKDLLTGTLKTGSKPVVRQIVRLYRYNVKAKKWILNEAHVTGKYGHVFFTVKPAVTSTYELVFRGSAKFAASRSNHVTIVVLPVFRAPTSLSISPAATSITAGQKDVITGTLTTGTKPVVRQIVRLYRYSTTAKKWILAQADVTGTLGHVFYTVKPAATTSYELVFLGSAHLRPSHSPVATITVTH
jgi:hypothetical protein